MRTIHQIFIGLLVIVNQSFAQKQVVLREDYTDNSGAWPLHEEPKYASEVSGGHYNIDLKKDGMFWWIWKPVTLNPKQAFVIEVGFTMKSQSKNGYFGLAWGVTNSKNNFTFSIGQSGKHALFETKDGAYDYKIKWTNSAKKIKLETGHVLKLQSDGKVYSFYLDDVLLAQHPYFAFDLDKSVGFYVENFVRVTVDYLEVRQDRGTINVVQGDDLGVVKKENLGSNINTQYPEKKPTISHDGKQLFFTRSDDPQNFGDDKSDDIWYAELGDEGLFGKAVNLGRPVNNKNNNSCIGIARDNSWIMLKGQYNESGEYLKQGFSISRRSGNTWSNPENVEVKNFVNKNQYHEACINPDGDVMMLAIETDNSYGDKDLYFSKKQPDGTWSEPVNCGAVINSFAAEIGPFIAGDGKTVYFASEGHPGYGAADVFMSVRLDDTWTNWSTPVNLGPTINTAKWDAYFSTDAKGEWGYMVSTENSIGRTDIFRFKLPQKAKPKPTCVVKGTIINAKTNQPMIGELTFHILDTDSLLGTIYATPGDGKFSMVLKEGFHYSINVSYPGYLGERVSVDMSNVEESVEKELVVYLKPIERNTTIELNNVFFEPDKSDLMYMSKAQLHWVLLFMKDNPNAVILIGGHAAKGDGNEKYYQKLSEKRARAVFDYLVEIGVPKKRMKYKGYGFSQPVYDSGSPADAGRNRCVNFTILQNK